MRNILAAGLIAVGIATVLLGGPTSGLNGWTVLGVLLTIAGIVTAND